LLNLDIVDIRGVKVVYCAGRLVFGDEAEYFKREVRALLPEDPRIVLVLKNLNRVDSQGVGLIVELLIKARRAGGDVRLASVVNKDVLETMTITKMPSIFQIFDDDQKAISSFSETAPTSSQ
jgi:anti-sigma B factor antagonist